MSHFPRALESAIRRLRAICEDDKNPVDVLLRASELIVSSYGLAHIPEHREPRRKGLKAVVQARLQMSAVDKEIVGRLAEARKERKLQRRIDRLLAEPTTKENL